MQFEEIDFTPSFKEALAVLVVIIAIIATGIIHYELVPHIPILMSFVFLYLYGRVRGLSSTYLEKAAVNGASSGLGAIFIFFFIGMLISSWIASGTIPTIMYYGFQWVSSSSFYAVVFLVTSLLGLCIGSSLTTAATIGVAFIGMASAMDFSLNITAGAIISGAFLGDKMSPLSDTTNLASETAGVGLFEHIKNMLWTTIPGFFITFVLFFMLSPEESIGTIENIELLRSALNEETNIGLLSLVPFLMVAVLALKKIPAIPTLALGVVSAVIIAFIESPDMTVAKMANILFSGFTLESGIQQLDSILSRGGVESMMFSVSLVLLALGMGGLLFQTGIIPSLLNAILHTLHTGARLITATVCTAVGINFLIGEQYLSILLTSKTYQSKFKELGLAGKSLSRTLEDAGTVVNPLVPWGVCGVFLTKVLEVPTIEYAPFAFFCLLCPLLSLISGYTKIGLHYTK